MKIFLSILFLFFASFPLDLSAQETHHSSYPTATEEKIDLAYQSISLPPPVYGPIRAAIVNHHLLADTLIARVMRSLENEQIKTIILVSPDHFSAGKKRVSTTYLPWHTPYGNLNTNTTLIDKLIEKGFVAIDDAPFTQEHGISGIVPFIKKSLPQSLFIPIIVKETANNDVIDNLASYLALNTPHDTLVIGSFDFSHYLPEQFADFHDEKSIQVISYFDYNAMRMLDIDSRQGLRLVSRYAELVGSKNFTIFDHTNSVRITGRHDASDTTSYITGVYTQNIPTTQPEESITILFVGDIMLDRGVRRVMEKHGMKYPFKKIERLLGGSDILIGNLEGPITDYQSKSISSNSLTFTFSPLVVPTLKKMGFSAVSLANNHTLNFGKEGFSQTKKYLIKEGIQFFGDPKNKKNISVVITVRNMKIGLVGFHGLVKGGQEAIMSEIKKIKNSADIIVVYPHWGSEYQVLFSKNQQKDAHAFIDAGADFIIGSHPHVIQPMELYRGKPIFYSLGNFIFDQTFSQETQRGLALGVTVKKDSFVVTFMPLQSTALQVDIMEKTRRKTFFSWFAKKSVVPVHVRDKLRGGMLELSRNNN